VAGGERGPTPPEPDDGRGDGDLLHLVVEIKGYRREDAKETKATMDTYWVHAVNHLGTLGRWAFAEPTEIYQIDADFKARVATEFDAMLARASGAGPTRIPRGPGDRQVIVLQPEEHQMALIAG
jgi:hypothetical protein